MPDLDYKDFMGEDGKFDEEAFTEAFVAACEAERAEAKKADEPYKFDPDLIPDLGDESPTGYSDAAMQVDAAYDSITIFEIYERLSKGKYGDKRRDGEGIKISCPIPGHTDNNPSAWIKSKGVPRNETWFCGACQEGGGRVEIARFAWGDMPFWEVKKRLAKEFRGVDYDALTAPPPAPAPPTPTQVADDPVAAAKVAETYLSELDKEVNRTRIRFEAVDIVKRERKAAVSQPLGEGMSLEDELAITDEVDEWTIEDLHQYGNNTILNAQKKTGKSETMRNLLRSLADGKPFLDRHEVRKLDGRIAYMNLEIIDRTFRGELRKLDIVNTKKVTIHNLKGMAWDLQEDYAFASTVDLMKRQEIEVLIIDPFADAFRGELTNEGVDPFLKRLDELKVQAGIVDLFMPVHMGKDDSRGSRGLSRIEDWADTIWTLVRNENNTRFLSAEGRLVNMEKREVIKNIDGRLVYGIATPATSAASARSMNKIILLGYIKDHPGSGVRAIKDAHDGIIDKVMVGKLLKEMRENDEVRWEQVGQAITHYPWDES